MTPWIIIGMVGRGALSVAVIGCIIVEDEDRREEEWCARCRAYDRCGEHDRDRADDRGEAYD